MKTRILGNLCLLLWPDQFPKVQDSSEDTDGDIKECDFFGGLFYNEMC